MSSAIQYWDECEIEDIKIREDKIREEEDILDEDRGSRSEQNVPVASGSRFPI